ncbi:MAG: sulfatase, partial [Opitutae bacterium]|nr:sulfatase [Opitutae bacterium]
MFLFLNLLSQGFLWGEKSPNVLFIAIDDLNDWVGCLGGHPQTKTPNLDRLAASGTLFANAHCPAPACNPSRSAIFTGISPHVSGLYRNEQKMRDVLPDAELLPKTFSRSGYRAEGSGKMLHYFIDAQSWDEYFPARETENPFPQTMDPSKRPVSLIRGGSWQYYETDWGPINATDKEYGGDYSVVEWVGKRLSEKREKPFFLACGIYRPHEPWFVPKKYFDAFPIDEIKLPPGYVRNDLEDIPNRGKQLARNRYFPHILKENQWKQGIQGYLASIHFADAMLGLLLDALENGPNANNTIVVLWSDHGWHLGEKEHWQKFTLWRACTRVPLIIRVPAGISRSLIAGTKPSLCSKPVNLLSLAPTLFELCGLDSSGKHDGPSLVPLLENPNASWGHVSLTHLQEPGSYGLSEENWRYIRYANGEEELYNIKKDPFEWDNLVSFPKYAEHLERLRKKGPTEFAKLFVPKLESLSNLKWIPLSKGKQSPASKPIGHSFDTRFINYGKRD